MWGFASPPIHTTLKCELDIGTCGAANKKMKPFLELKIVSMKEFYTQKDVPQRSHAWREEFWLSSHCPHSSWTSDDRGLQNHTEVEAHIKFLGTPLKQEFITSKE